MSRLFKGTVVFCIYFSLICPPFLSDADARTSRPDADSKSEPAALWVGDIGDGFRYGQKLASVSLGAGIGMEALGSRKEHDLALAYIAFGMIVSDVLKESSFLRGNFEMRGELFGGAQYDPEVRHIIALAYIIRYNFATGTRFIPFLEGGAGISETDIGRPDLSTDFQFNLQTGIGSHYFFSPNMAVTILTRFLHFSNGGIEEPNRGVNSQVIAVGLTWLF